MDLDKINGIQEALFGTVKMMFDEYSRGLNFDKTAVYTIYDDSEKDKGRYMVGESENIVFTACSPNQNYKKGDKVYVTVPQGDTSKTKFIVSAYLDPVAGLGLDYRAPHAAIAPDRSLTNSLAFSSQKAYLGKQTYVSNDCNNFIRVENDYSRLYLGVGFENKFHKDSNANYSIQVILITSNLENNLDNYDENAKINDILAAYEKLGPTYENLLICLQTQSNFALNTFTFSQDRMLGNLKMQGSSLQEDLIDISGLRNIIGVLFFLETENTHSEDFVMVKSLEWSFGKDQQEMEESLLRLYSANSLQFSEGESIQKLLYIKRGAIDPDTNRYYIDSKISPNFSGIFVYGRANSQDADDSGFLSYGWDEFYTGNSPIYNLQINSINSIEEYKAAELIREADSSELKVKAQSNSLVFYNVTVNIEDRPVGTLYLKPQDGIYEHKIYGLDGKINNIKDFEKFRHLQVSTVNKEGQQKTPIAIHWYYPKENSMIQDITYEDGINASTQLSNRYKQTLTNYEVKTKVTLSGDKNNVYECLIIHNPESQQNYLGGYAIDYYYNPLYINNEIICRYYYSATEFDEGRFTPKFGYFEEPQDDFELVLSFVNNERPFIAYNPQGYVYDATSRSFKFYIDDTDGKRGDEYKLNGLTYKRTSEEGVFTHKTVDNVEYTFKNNNYYIPSPGFKPPTSLPAVKYIPPGITWNIYSPFYPSLTKEELSATSDEYNTIKQNEFYRVKIVKAEIQDKDYSFFSLHPVSVKSAYYLFLNPDVEGENPEKIISNTGKKIQGCIVNFEVAITDLLTNVTTIKTKKIAIPIKQESGESMKIKRRSGWDPSSYDKEYSNGEAYDGGYNPWYIEDKQLGILSQNQPAGLKCSSVFKYGPKGGAESYSTSTLEAFGEFTSYLEYVIPTTMLNGKSEKYKYINLFDKNRVDNYQFIKIPQGSELVPAQGQISTFYIGRPLLASTDNIKNYWWQKETGNGNIMVLDLAASYDFTGYYLGSSHAEIPVKTSGDDVDYYWSQTGAQFTLNNDYNLSMFNETIRNKQLDNRWKITSNSSGDKPASWLPLTYILAEGEKPYEKLMIYNSLEKGFYFLVYSEINATIPTSYYNHYYSEGSQQSSATNLYFYKVLDLDGKQVKITGAGTDMKIIPKGLWNNIDNSAYVYVEANRSFVLKSETQEPTETDQKLYYLESRSQEISSFEWLVSSSRTYENNILPQYAPSIQSRSDSTKKEQNQYLKPHAIYFPTNEVFYISAWSGDTLVWQQPIIIYGPDETPTNTQESEAMGSAAEVEVKNNEAVSIVQSSISLGQDITNTISALSGVGNYGLVSTVDNEAIFVLSEKGDMVIDLTKVDINGAKQEIAITPDKLKIQTEDGNLLSLKDYIKKIAGIT